MYVFKCIYIYMYYSVRTCVLNIWYALDADAQLFAAATYRSALMRLDIAESSVRMLPPNSVLTVDLNRFEVQEWSQVSRASNPSVRFKQILLSKRKTVRFRYL